MTPKEKAKELIEHYAETIEPIEFGVILERNWKLAKFCAIVAVDELIDENEYLEELVQAGLKKQYWQEVKQEIEKL